MHSLDMVTSQSTSENDSPDKPVAIVTGANTGIGRCVFTNLKSPNKGQAMNSIHTEI